MAQVNKSNIDFGQPMKSSRQSSPDQTTAEIKIATSSAYMDDKSYNEATSTTHKDYTWILPWSKAIPHFKGDVTQKKSMWVTTALINMVHKLKTLRGMDRSKIRDQEFRETETHKNSKRTSKFQKSQITTPKSVRESQAFRPLSHNQSPRANRNTKFSVNLRQNSNSSSSFVKKAYVDRSCLFGDRLCLFGDRIKGVLEVAPTQSP
ncbi:hypothetical protein H6P81_018019 [Aristolochia fimbriata]|uniref:Uncharacterized protein n=1 Tax=Aristolochia fimbriata TaxID=158543 RepID=A0AAV7E1V8_ARIFI|nr:hypothetical protein H6P81_018019 [Aristolochia fimbriata]